MMTSQHWLGTWESTTFYALQSCVDVPTVIFNSKYLKTDIPYSVDYLYNALKHAGAVQQCAHGLPNRWPTEGPGHLLALAFAPVATKCASAPIKHTAWPGSFEIRVTVYFRSGLPCLVCAGD